MKKVFLCVVVLSVIAGCSGNTSGDNASSNASTGPDMNAGECCPAERPFLQTDCSAECGPCEYGYEPAECGGITVECNGSNWVEVSHTDPTEACFAEDMGGTDLDMGASDMGADASADMAEDTGYFPDVPPQDCFHPSTDPNCPMGEFGAGTFLDYIELDESEACCRDFTGDGINDNKIGKYARILKGTGQSINDNIDLAVQSGALVYLFEYANWSNDTFDPDLDMRIFLGTDADIDFSDNLAGNGDFYVRPESYDENGDPRWVFDDVQVNNGRLRAAGGTLELFFPNLLDEVQMLVTDVQIVADVVTPADLSSGGRVALENGEISGALQRNLFYDSMNTAATACDCIGGPVFSYDAEQDDYQCISTAEIQTACEQDATAGSGCLFLSNRTACQFFELASGDIDVDTDGDGTVDAFSVGVKFTGVGASIIGSN